MRPRLLAPCVLAVAGSTLALAFEPAAQRTPLSIPRVTTVYVSAVDKGGIPVVDLAATDFVLKEGGDIREIVKVQRAVAPLQIVLIVDDSGTGIFRYPVANFVDRLLGHAQFAIRRIVGQAQRLADYTADTERLRAAVMNLGVRSETPEGGLIVEEIFQAAKELREREAERPVIVVMTDTEAEYSSLPAQHVLDELQRSGSLLYVIALIKRPVYSSPVPGGTPTADKPSDLLERQIDINRVLGDGPKQSGGRRAEIAGLGGAIPELQEIAEELNRQYLITYIVPSGARPNQKLNVSSKRRGVSVRAPVRGRTS